MSRLRKLFNQHRRHRYFSYRKKNHNQNQKLERFRKIENRRMYSESTGKMCKDEHENTSKNADITFEVENIEPTQKGKDFMTPGINNF